MDSFKERTVTLPIVGQFVVYEYDPTLWVALGAEVGGTPAENLTIQCPETSHRPWTAFLAPPS